MAFTRKKKPLPTRRGRIRPGEAVTVETTTEVTTDAPAEAEPAAAEEPVVVRRTTKVSTGGGLEMALIVVTLVALVAAFALLQLEMHRAFGKGWPI